MEVISPGRRCGGTEMGTKHGVRCSDPGERPLQRLCSCQDRGLRVWARGTTPSYVDWLGGVPTSSWAGRQRWTWGGGCHVEEDSIQRPVSSDPANVRFPLPEIPMYSALLIIPPCEQCKPLPHPTPKAHLWGKGCAQAASGALGGAESFLTSPKHFEGSARSQGQGRGKEVMR